MKYTLNTRACNHIHFRQAAQHTTNQNSTNGYPICTRLCFRTILCFYSTQEQTMVSALGMSSTVASTKLTDKEDLPVISSFKHETNAGEGYASSTLRTTGPLHYDWRIHVCVCQSSALRPGLKVAKTRAPLSRTEKMDVNGRIISPAGGSPSNTCRCGSTRDL